MSKTKLLIFDFDGTLVDSAAGIHKSLNIVAKEYDLPEFPLPLVKSMVGYGLTQLLQNIDPESKKILSNLPEIRHRFLEVYRELSTQEVSFFPGIIDFLNQSPYLVAIASNKEERPLKNLVNNSELSKVNWVHICGADTYSEKKPHPMPLLEVMSAAGVHPNESIMIGDGLPDAMSSKAAQIPFIGVSFGYANTDDLRAHGAREIISDYSELNQAIDKIDTDRVN